TRSLDWLSTSMRLENCGPSFFSYRNRKSMQATTASSFGLSRSLALPLLPRQSLTTFYSSLLHPFVLFSTLGHWPNTGVHWLTRERSNGDSPPQTIPFPVRL